jgi:hypothetical protein
MDEGSKFRRATRGVGYGSIDVMVCAESHPVATLAYSPLLHYAFRVANATRRHTFSFYCWALLLPRGFSRGAAAWHSELLLYLGGFSLLYTKS